MSALGNIVVTYDLSGYDPERIAEEIACEQTTELRRGTAEPELEARVIGKVREIEPLEAGLHRIRMAYSADLCGGEVCQLINLLYGNISMKQGIRLVEIAWPRSLLDCYKGPAFGIDGIRRLTGVPRRPLICAALKPLGASLLQLADRCRRLADGGADIIKDDHGLADQRMAPFSERVRVCRAAVAASGSKSLYMPNVTAQPLDLRQRVNIAFEAGCRGVMVTPMIAGMGAVREASRDGKMVVLAHPSGSGVFFGRDHGIAKAILLGDLYRLIGSDAVIYPAPGGRFPFSREDCVAINDHLRRRMGSLKPSLPVSGGGVEVERVAGLLEWLGRDAMFLIGGGFYQKPDLSAAVAGLREALEEYGGPDADAAPPDSG